MTFARQCFRVIIQEAGLSFKALCLTYWPYDYNNMIVADKPFAHSWLGSVSRYLRRGGLSTQNHSDRRLATGGRVNMQGANF
jgi:hypothetical protein